MDVKKAVQIVKEVIVVGKDAKFSLEVVALKNILLDPRVANKKVMLVAIAGKFREGKSFLLNFLLRYLRHLTSNAPGNWLDPAVPLQKAFEFKGSHKAVTNGVWLYPEPFVLRNGRGEEVAVLLMDSQGAWDPKKKEQDNSVLFALSLLVSSVLIYNVKENIGKDHLDTLQFFAHYGKMVPGESQSQGPPFQSLIFLVRDWCYEKENPFGFEGGQQLLDEEFGLNDSDVSEEVRQQRGDIFGLFNSIRAFLMPHPGSSVAGKDNQDLGGMDDEFLAMLPKFVEDLFAPQNLVPKMVNGKVYTGKELNSLMQNHFEVFKSVPEAGSLFETTAKVHNLSAIANVKEHYSQQMNEHTKSSVSSDSDVLRRLHAHFKAEAIQEFKSAPKMGGNQPSYEQALGQELDKLFHDIEASAKANARQMADAQRNREKQQQKKQSSSGPCGIF